MDIWRRNKLSIVFFIFLCTLINLKSHVNGEDFFIFRPYPVYVGLESTLPSPGSNKLEGKSSTLSPEQALDYAKLLVLSVNDTSRQQGLRSYGTDKKGMERMLEEWMNEHTNRTFLRPFDVGLRIGDDPYGFEKLRSTPAPWNYIPGVPTLDGKKRLDLPGAKFWEVGNPAAQPLQPLPITTMRYHIDRNIREEDNVPGKRREDAETKFEDPSDLINETSLKTTPIQNQSTTASIEKSSKATNLAAAPKAAGINEEINKLIDHEDENIDMYDYKSPSWDEMPTLALLTQPAMSPKEPDPSPPDYASPGMPFNPPTTPNTNHRAVVRAKEIMRTHHLKYMSAFICGFCEILSIHKEGKLTMQLTHGAVAVVGDLIHENKLAHLGSTTRDKLTKYVNFMVMDKPDQIKSMADYVHQLFENHSYFANDTREVVEDIESWFMVSEGEALLQTLISVEEFPKQGKHQRVIMREVAEALLKPYIRIGPSDRRAKTLDKLEIIMNRVHRRQLSAIAAEDKNKERIDQITRSVIKTYKDWNPKRIHHRGYYYNMHKTEKLNKMKYFFESNNHRYTKHINNTLNGLSIEIPKRIQYSTGQIINKHDSLDDIKKTKSDFKLLPIQTPKRHSLYYTITTRRTHLDKDKKNKKFIKHKYEIEKPIHQYIQDRIEKYHTNESPKYHQSLNSRNKLHKQSKYTTRSDFLNTNQRLQGFYNNNEISKEETTRPEDKLKHIEDTKKEIREKHFDSESKDTNELDKSDKQIREVEDIISKYGSKMSRLTKQYYIQKRYTSITREPMWSKHKSVTPKPEETKSQYTALKSKENMYVETKINQRFKENFIAKPEITSKKNFRKFLEESSYSDDEYDIKVKLNDALIHDDKAIFRNADGRRKFNNSRPEKTIRDHTSESDEEGIYKSNIYKAFGYKLKKTS